jgi:hypothetical protein
MYFSNLINMTYNHESFITKIPGSYTICAGLIDLREKVDIIICYSFIIFFSLHLALSLWIDPLVYLHQEVKC